MSGQYADTAARELLTDIGLANAYTILFLKCYQLNSNRQTGASTWSSAKNKFVPILVTLTSIADRDILCGIVER